MNTTQSEEYDDYVKRKIWRPFLTDSNRNYEEESKTWKSFSQEETNNEYRRITVLSCTTNKGI